MLLQFSAENVTCFKDEVVFSMVSGADDRHPEHLLTPDAAYKHRMLRATALYGANAHGKTKLIEAMALAQYLIVNGSKPKQSLPVEPFRLDPVSLAKPSRFEFVMFVNGMEYTYGFVIDTARVHEEWLFGRRPKGREVRFFERLTNAKGETTVEIGRPLVGTRSKKSGRDGQDEQFLAFVAVGTRENQLFLTEAVERNVKKLKPLYGWFSETLTIIPANAPSQPIEVRAHKEGDFITFMGNFLRLAGTGIEGIAVHEEQLDFDKWFPNAREDFRQRVEDDIAKGGVVTISTEHGRSFAIMPGELGPLLVRLKTEHRASDGTMVQFDFEDESSGTQRLMQILPILADLRSGDRVYVIDELDRKLHPLLSRLFIETFLNQSEGCSSQLIFTTHETSLLDLELLRRDEIWFVEKDRVGTSHLYSLASLKIRPDLKIERGYLQGRFGAIPFIGDISLLGWCCGAGVQQ